MKAKSKKIVGLTKNANIKTTAINTPYLSHNKKMNGNKYLTATKSIEVSEIQKIPDTEQSIRIDSSKMMDNNAINCPTSQKGIAAQLQTIRISKTTSHLNKTAKDSKRENANGIKSTLDIRERRNMFRMESLMPFPKVDPEFYSGENNILWSKELMRAETEKKILYRPPTEKRFNESNMNVFGKSDIFSIRKDSIDLENKLALQPVRSKANLSRTRDFHSESMVLGSKRSETSVQNPDHYVVKDRCIKNGIKTIYVDLRPSKKLTPMHFKLYESTMQDDNNISKRPLPKSHPTYNKIDDCFNPKSTASFRKKQEVYATTYNFLKASSRKK